MRFRRYRSVLKFFCGFLCSFSFSLFTMYYIWRIGCRILRLPTPRYRTLSEETNAKELVLVGILTHMATITTRAVGINNTWGGEIPGKLLFFVGLSENRTEVDLPLVVLPVADEIYPPQRKSMLMLSYIYEHYGHRFQWFIRADDDVYFRLDNLASLLRSVSSSDDILLGHPGTGKTSERGKLGLYEDSNFCIGGTGVIMSQSVLRKVYPSLQRCLRETVTTHEDSEIGRCLRKFVGVQCPWGYEASEFFYQEYGDSASAYHGDLDTIPFEKVVSLHPVKDDRYQYRLHVYYLSTRERLNKNRSQRLQKQQTLMKKLLALAKISSFNYLEKPLHCHKDLCEQLHDNDSAHGGDDQPAVWTFFQNSQRYNAQSSFAPIHAIANSEEDGVQRVLQRAQLAIKEEARPQLYHSFYFGKYQVGYSIQHPTHGNLYEIQYLVKVKRYVDGALDNVRLPMRAKLKESFGSLESCTVRRKLRSELVNIVLPLAGRLEDFRNFMKKVEEMLVKFHEALRVLVVFFRHVTSSKPFRFIFDSVGRKLGVAKFIWLEADGAFNPTVALQASLNYLSKTNSLLLFSQVEFIFDSSFLQRCRDNVGAGKMYFPVPFRTYKNAKTGRRNVVFDGRFGGLDREEFSTFCAHSSDIMIANRMNEKNMTLNDLPLVEKFLAGKNSRLDIFRAPDPGLSRGFIAKQPCGMKFTEDCDNGFNSTNELFSYMMKKNYLIDYL